MNLLAQYTRLLGMSLCLCAAFTLVCCPGNQVYRKLGPCGQSLCSCFIHQPMNLGLMPGVHEKNCCPKTSMKSKTLNDSGLFFGSSLGAGGMQWSGWSVQDLGPLDVVHAHPLSSSRRNFST